LRSYFYVKEMPIGKCRAVVTFVKRGQTIEMYWRCEVERDALQVETASLVRAYVYVRIFAFIAASWGHQESLE
jgi:hypothetical protein